MAAIPSKTTLNLLIRENPKGYYPKMLTLFLVALVAISAFSKFGVYDRLEAVNLAEREAASVKVQLETITTANAEYPTVKLDYKKHFSYEQTYGTGIIDCSDVLTLIEHELMTKAGIMSASFKDNALTVILIGIDLATASTLLNSLYVNPIVTSVTINNASSSKDGSESMAMIIYMSSEAENGGNAK